MKIGIIGAMEIEIAYIKKEMKVTRSVRIAGREYSEGTVRGREAVVVRCGIGKVCAGMSVQAMKDIFGVSHLINTGVAGALSEGIGLLDVVVSRDAIFHDVDACSFGYAPGELPQLGERVFRADPTLRRAALAAVRAVVPDTRVIEGRVASGDQVISDRERKLWIRRNMEADCCEMEGAAVAEAGFLNGLPFVIIRAISDMADGENLTSYDRFETIAARRSALIVLDMLERL